MRSKGMLCGMGTRRHPRDPPYNAEDIRAYEVRRVFNKLSLSLEHTEAIENLSRTLVDELVCGPIAETAARVQMPSESAASGERWRGREGVQVVRAQ
jgi:Glutamyl-tRNAGlu reductase, dimerisation domain